MERRITGQRKKIFEYVSSVRTHPTAEDVYEAVKKEIPSITLATVYRNLHILVEQGKISKLGINNEYHFDGLTQAHQHLVCNKCDKISDFEDKELNEYVLKKISGNSFNVTELSIQAEGICMGCSNGSN